MSGPRQVTGRRPPRIAFAGDRDIAVDVLDDLLAARTQPLALLIADPDRATHADELRQRCPWLGSEHVLTGRAFGTPDGIARLRALDLDLIICVHFPYIVPEEVLRLPREGVLNLHPAYLPYNRGWHTPSWAILDGTPAGATLHFMDAGIDTGDIVHQRRLAIAPDETAHALYLRLKAAEREVFREAWLDIARGSYSRRPQRGEGTSHVRRELLSPAVQEIDLDAPTTARELFRKLRALTTDRRAEAAWFEEDGARFRVQLTLTREAIPSALPSPDRHDREQELNGGAPDSPATERPSGGDDTSGDDGPDVDARTPAVGAQRSPV